MNQDKNKRLSLWATLLCIIVIALIALDMTGDYQEGIALGHILIELLILLVSLVGAVYFAGLYYQTTQSAIQVLTQDLDLAHQQALQWRETNRTLVAGLSAQILKQFNVWTLTAAEAEVGMLLLKGLSHQEIANTRSTSERTIREQSRAIYRKAGLRGRSELSAFFLEDLLPPHEISE